MSTKWIDRARGWLLDRLGIKSADARAGRWWEVDFLLLFLVGVALFAIAALLGL